MLTNRFDPVVEIQNQVLREAISITGTHFSLHYRSDRVPGCRAAYSLQIPLSGPQVPPNLHGIALEVHIAGRTITQRFPPTAEQTHTFIWDGKDANGRALPGKQPVMVRVGYVYPSAGQPTETIRWQEWTGTIGGGDVLQAGLGGWSLSVHHAYDPVGQVLYLGDGRRRDKLAAMERASQAESDGNRRPEGELAIAAEDGGELYSFDRTGRHLQTLSTLTGALVYRFAYDAAGRLTSVTDGDGNVTRIERTQEGAPSAIIAPRGQGTTLTTHPDSYLATIANPAGETNWLSYSDGGLLVSLTDPRDNTYIFTYDDQGRLTLWYDPAAAFSMLARTPTQSGFQVSQSTALGRELTYVVEREPTGERRVNQCCGAHPTVVNIDRDGTETVTYPDGTTAIRETQPDPRFGAQAPFVKKAVRKTPAGLEMSVSISRAVTLSDPGNPLSLKTLTDLLNVNGRVYTSTLDARNRRAVFRTPEGRQIVLGLDDQGRVLRAETTGIEPVIFAYDPAGHLNTARQGGGIFTYGYDRYGRLSMGTDANGNAFQLTYDDAGRLVQSALPSGRTYHFAYDATGNLTQITLPNRAEHTLQYTAANSVAGYTTPGDGSYALSYNNERQITQSTLPSGRRLDLSYDPNGDLERLSYSEATVDLAYQPGTRQLSNITRTPATHGNAQEITFAHDGDLVTETAWSGIATGRYAYRYDDNFLLRGVTLGESPEILLTRDADGLLTGLGPFTIAREGPAGAPSQLTDGRLAITVEYDRVGRVTARAHTVAGRHVYQMQLTYDNVDHIAQKQEVVEDVAHTSSYSYDADGQLTQVARDGAVVERYTYDENGNRVSRQVGSTVRENARYDTQDRLVVASVHYRFDADGFLMQRGSESFTYSVYGELLQATLTAGETITYAYDGLGRRVARTDASGTYQYLYGNPSHPAQITASRDPAGTLSHYYYDEAGFLFAVQRDDTWYYVATDQVGSPRVVFDAEGRVVKVRDYDSFGRLATENNPTFDLPIGFAGGLADSATGLVRFGWRDYDPEAGRWTAKDPAGFAGGLNLYSYVGQNPLIYIDPLGIQGAPVTPLAPPNAGAAATQIVAGTAVAGTGGGLGYAAWISAGAIPAEVAEAGEVGLIGWVEVAHTAGEVAFLGTTGLGLAILGGALIYGGIKYFGGAAKGALTNPPQCPRPGIGGSIPRVQ